MSRNLEFAEGEYYHIYNRGVDKRTITEDNFDSNRFLQSLVAFNNDAAIGSLYKQLSGTISNFSHSVTQLREMVDNLVEMVAYCLMPNHFHLIVTPVAEDGVSKFMHKLGMGYARYFNEKYERKGSLFQGAFRARHIRDNEDLLKMSAYVNLNHKIHDVTGDTTKFVRSSIDEYIGNAKVNFCQKDIIVDQFNSSKDYLAFANETVRRIRALRKALGKEEYSKEIYVQIFD